MAAYWVKTPAWFKRVFPKNMIWEMPDDTEPAVYLTFDDGPHPAATTYVLEQLARYNAKATFFCVGNNVTHYSEVYQQILDAGHATGNHTYNHVNGWKADADHYMKNIDRARKYINSRSFRPPYGRIKYSQMRKFRQRYPRWKIYMWDILSGDFDKDISPQECLDNVLTHIRPGSIIVFHDSEKAFERMSYALPHVLAYCRSQHWEMRSLP
jgi:peptidoglycan-N-acetylglucosamine deacetylase